MRNWRFFVLMGFLLAGFNSDALAQDNAKLTTITITTAKNTKLVVKAEIANTDAERAKGLMFREKLSPDAGMLFLFDQEMMLTFWMKNTPLPLDIIFIGADKKIVSIAANAKPESEDLLQSAGPSLYVLEVNANYCANNGVAAGDSLTF